MNWGFVGWLTGVLFTGWLCLFVIDVFKELGSKNSRRDIIRKANKGISDSARKVADGIRQKWVESSHTNSEMKRPDMDYHR